jgi:hypothetical protein
MNGKTIAWESPWFKQGDEQELRKWLAEAYYDVTRNLEMNSREFRWRRVLEISRTLGAEE